MGVVEDPSADKKKGGLIRHARDINGDLGVWVKGLGGHTEAVLWGKTQELTFEYTRRT